MKNKKIIVSLVILIFAGLVMYLENNTGTSEESLGKTTRSNDRGSSLASSKMEQSKNSHDDNDHHGHNHHPHKQGKGSGTFTAQDNDEQELLSFHRELKVIYNSDDALERITEILDKNQMEPKKAVDSNPYTGTMTTVRSQKSSKGTRYHHAQFFTDEDGKIFLQHYSMEFRPSPNAFERVRSMVESNYGVSNGKLSADGSFVNYELDEGYILWVKKMGEEDLTGNPFNAYSKEDIGTIRIAIEQEIHGDHDNEHLEPPRPSN